MEAAINIVNLTKRYEPTTALDALNLRVNEGEVLGYLGPNGAGKTTTIRLMLGLIRPTAGQVHICGLDAQKETAAAHKKIAYVPGEASLWPNLTGAETLRLLANTHGTVDEAYQKELLDLFRFDPHKRVRAYSKGNKQKITLIAALASRAEILIFDEPTAGLDPLMEMVFREQVKAAKARGQTVFLSSHILEEVESVCDRIAVIREGKLVEQGTLKELRHLSAVTVEATFPGQPPTVSHLKNVKHVHVDGKTLHVQVQGDIAELLQIIAAAKPHTLLSREPSLEELFLSLYGENTKNMSHELARS